MKYKRFEDLPVWKAAARFYIDVEALVEDNSFQSSGDLRSQLLRASLSISNNIAEGFELGTTSAILNYIYIARGSAGESRSMLHIVRGSEKRSALRQRTAGLIAATESISAQLGAWADSLQNSEIQGRRYLNDATRARYDQRRRAEAFMDRIRQETAEAAAQREAERLAELERERAAEQTGL
jgi:four helix bundle protein